MTFIWPLMLLSLLLIPLFIVLYVRIQQRRQKIVENVGSLGFVQDASGGRVGRRRHIPPMLFLSRPDDPAGCAGAPAGGRQPAGLGKHRHPCL